MSGHRAGPARRTDHPGLSELAAEECLGLLATAPIGRLGLTVGALPLVLPVNFALSELGILVRTSSGSKLDAAVANQVVCFEADGVDVFAHGGWSVVVTGVARVLTDGEVAQISATHLPHWVDDGAEHVVAIATEHISGRRLQHQARSIV